MRPLIPLFWISGHACPVREKCSLYHFEECNYFYRPQRSCDKVTPPPPPSACWDTVNKRAVRILLECILVWNTLAYRTNILRQNYSVSYQHCLELEDNKDNVMWCSFHLISCGVFSRRNLCPTNKRTGNSFTIALLSKESCLHKTPTSLKDICLLIYWPFIAISELLYAVKISQGGSCARAVPVMF